MLSRNSEYDTPPTPVPFSGWFCKCQLPTYLHQGDVVNQGLQLCGLERGMPEISQHQQQPECGSADTNFIDGVHGLLTKCFAMNQQLMAPVIQSPDDLNHLSFRINNLTKTHSFISMACASTGSCSSFF